MRRVHEMPFGARLLDGRILDPEAGTVPVQEREIAVPQRAERRQPAELGGVLRRVLWRSRSRRRVRREARGGDENADDHSTLRLSLRISVDHLVSS